MLTINIRSIRWSRKKFLIPTHSSSLPGSHSLTAVQFEKANSEPSPLAVGNMWVGGHL